MTNKSESRRQFLKMGGLAALTAAIPFDLKAEVKMPLVDSPNYWDLIRAQFILDENIIYLNNGTMGPSPISVINKLKEAIEYTNRSGHYGGGKGEALQSLALLTKVEAKNIALTHNVTEGINIVCWGVKLKKGDEVIITSHEHVGGALPWLYRAKIDKFTLKVVDLASTAEETLNNIKKATTSKTKVIAVPHMPCTIGQVLPVKEICAFAKARNIFSFIDGAHGAGMLNIDLKDMGCDAYASCCHKWLLGPKGTGFLYVNPAKLEEVETKFVGGYSSKDWDVLQNPVYFEGLAADAHRYHYGTQSAALYFGIEAAVNFHLHIGQQKIEDRVKFLGNYLQEKLLLLPQDRITMLTPIEARSRAGVIAFKPLKKDYLEVANEMRKSNIILRSVPENKVNCIRVSTHIYNSEKEIDTCVETLSRLV